MGTARREEAGFTLIEAVIVLAITLMIGAAVYRITRSAWLLYRVQTHVAERGFTASRSLDDMAVEIARAGFGLGQDALPVFPGSLDGIARGDAITLRSNPSGRAAGLREDLLERDQLVKVEGAAQFAAGDEVLLIDEDRNAERAQVTLARPDALAFKSRETSDGKLERSYLPARGARLVALREVGFFSTTDRYGVAVLVRKATGQAEQVIARYVDSVHFEYFDEAGERMEAKDIEPGVVPGAVRIALRLRPNPTLPPVVVPPVSLFVTLEPQSTAIAFDAMGYHTVGLAAVIGRDALTGGKKARMQAWRRPVPEL
jgi:hypothetical protein